MKLFLIKLLFDRKIPEKRLVIPLTFPCECDKMSIRIEERTNKSTTCLQKSWTGFGERERVSPPKCKPVPLALGIRNKIRVTVTVREVLFVFYRQ